MTRTAVFAGLVFDEQGRALEVVHVGDEPYYVIDDDGFRRHIESEQIDRQVLASFKQQIDENKDVIEEGVMGMIGQDDPFTKAAIGSQLGNLDKVLQTGIPEEARRWMGMMGFKIIVDLHGTVIDIEGGGIIDESDE